ncbi:hypothetical protein EX30DRAFT_338390 [Ascodesmis nigricans]|uniref:Uncharacterized protein n=1 Tax=Ascodesmis nigricans TaxID=341454 RepID=A0A4S2N3K9_9PEZI|nr:hypothetical protein EX30DRAFT_338390 [Ascodesmis nigricans]
MSNMETLMPEPVFEIVQDFDASKYTPPIHPKPQFPPSIHLLPKLHARIIALTQERNKRHELFASTIDSLRSKLAQIDAYLCSVVGDPEFYPADMVCLEKLWMLCQMMGENREIMELVEARVAMETAVEEVERRLKIGNEEIASEIEAVKGEVATVEDWIRWTLEEEGSK